MTSGAVGNRPRDDHGGDDELGVRAPQHRGDHPLADVSVLDAVAHLTDRPRALVPDDVGGRGHLAAGPVQRVAALDADRLDLDEHPTGVAARGRGRPRSGRPPVRRSRNRQLPSRCLLSWIAGGVESPPPVGRASKAGFPGRESHPCNCPRAWSCWWRQLPPAPEPSGARHFPEKRGAIDGRRFPDARRDPRRRRAARQLARRPRTGRNRSRGAPGRARGRRHGRRRRRRHPPVPPGRGAGRPGRARERRDPHRREAVRRDDRPVRRAGRGRGHPDLERRRVTAGRAGRRAPAGAGRTPHRARPAAR